VLPAASITDAVMTWMPFADPMNVIYAPESNVTLSAGLGGAQGEFTLHAICHNLCKPADHTPPAICPAGSPKHRQHDATTCHHTPLNQFRPTLQALTTS